MCTDSFKCLSSGREREQLGSVQFIQLFWDQFRAGIEFMAFQFVDVQFEEFL